MLGKHLDSLVLPHLTELDHDDVETEVETSADQMLEHRKLVALT